MTEWQRTDETGVQRSAASTVGIGFLGCGTVGAEAVRILQNRSEEILRRTGVALEVRRVAVRDLSRDRDVPLPADAFTSDPLLVVQDPQVDLVVEVIGGIDPANFLLTEALKAGKPVVTANKELMAKFGPELLELAESAGVDILFEAAVGGGIPIIRPVTESLAGESARRIIAILNGTTNYILTRMTEDGVDLAEVLADAQRLGYAEADPTADIDGHDAAQKAAILASLAFGTRVHDEDVYREGIRDVRAHDVEMAARLGYVVKLVAIADLVPWADTFGVAVRVHPAMIPLTHPLASVRLSFNAIFLEGESVGELMFYGRGAGAGPTAVGLVGDVIDAARNLRQQARGPHLPLPATCPIVPIEDVHSHFYVRLEVADEPGVLSGVAGVFGRHEVSIQKVLQEGRAEDAELVLVTHRGREADVRATLRELVSLTAVKRLAAVFRVINGEEESSFS